MSTTNKAIVFLAITFLLSWGVTIGGHFSGLREGLGQYGPVLILVAMMAGPGIAAFICAIVFEKGRRVEALGLHIRPNIWWVWAWLIPIALSYASLAFTLLLTGLPDRHGGHAGRLHQRDHTHLYRGAGLARLSL
jgi:hypothetical protein